MKVAADVGFSPHVMALSGGDIEGYNVDLTYEIAKRMNIDVEIVDQEWSGIFTGLAAGKYAAIISPTTITEERAHKMLFSEAYFEVNHQFLIRKGAQQIEKLEDLKGKTIAVNRGNYYDRWLSARQNDYGWMIERFDKIADAIAAVAARRADAYFAGDTVAGWVAKNNSLFEPSTLVIPSGHVAGVVFDPSNAELRAEVEKVLECMKSDGTVARIHERWVGQTPRAGGAAYKVEPGIGVPGFPGYDEAPSGSGCS